MLRSKKSNIANINFGRYLGHLEKEPSACVAMAGCPGVDKVEFTIISENVFDSPAYVWTKDGSVNMIEMEVSYIKLFFTFSSKSAFHFVIEFQLGLS